MYLTKNDEEVLIKLKNYKGAGIHYCRPWKNVDVDPQPIRNRMSPYTPCGELWPDDHFKIEIKPSKETIFEEASSSPSIQFDSTDDEDNMDIEEDSRSSTPSDLEQVDETKQIVSFHLNITKEVITNLEQQQTKQVAYQEKTNPTLQQLRSPLPVSASSSCQDRYRRTEVKTNKHELLGNAKTSTNDIPTEYQIPETLVEPNQSQIVRVALEAIKATRHKFQELNKEVDCFNGPRTDTNYIYLEEMLIKNMLEIDSIDNEGSMDIRSEKRDIIKLIQDCLDKLQEIASSFE